MIQDVRTHYSQEGLKEKFSNALQGAGFDIENLSTDDLKPLDEFHIRGRKATAELFEKAKFTSDDLVLDIGSGFGGPARFLSDTYGSLVVGLDLTPDYADMASHFSIATGLDHRVRFLVGDGTRLPLRSSSFDGAFTQHINMNIQAKAQLFNEIARVLRAGGTYAFHEIALVDESVVRYPVPWASNRLLSHLAEVSEFLQHMENAGLKLTSWEDDTPKCIEFFENMLSMLRSGNPPKLGLHLIFGDQSPAVFENLYANLKEGRLKVLMGVATKR